MDRDSVTTAEKSWWTPVWRGLVVDPEGKHLRRMKSALGLYLYLLEHADRRSGRLVRKYGTIARDMGFPARTVRNWMGGLDFYDYIRITKTGRAMIIDVLKWRPIGQDRATLTGMTLPVRVAETGNRAESESPNRQEASNSEAKTSPGRSLTRVR